MTKLSDKILAEIEKEHIVPIPRWHFLVKNYVFWGLFGVSVVLGSLAFSVIADMKDSGDWDLLGHVQGNLLASAVMMLPYFWFLFLLAFALIAYYNWHHTRKGYLFKRRWIFLGSIASSLFLGGFFYAFGFGGKVDRLMANSLPLYGDSKYKAREELWLQPEKGLLMGRIVEVSQTGETVVVEDNKGRTWVVENVSGCQKKPKETEARGNTIKVVGKKSGDKSFQAQEIRKCGDCDDREEKKEDFKKEQTRKNEDNDEEERDSKE